MIYLMEIQDELRYNYMELHETNFCLRNRQLLNIKTSHFSFKKKKNFSLNISCIETFES